MRGSGGVGGKKKSSRYTTDCERANERREYNYGTTESTRLETTILKSWMVLHGARAMLAFFFLSFSSWFVVVINEEKEEAEDEEGIYRE